MQSLLLTYSGKSGGQHLTFKPTVLAVLLASGAGSYLYQEQPEGRPESESLAGQADKKSDFYASFYGAARAAEPQMQVRFVPAEEKSGIDLVSLPFADASVEHSALIAESRLDEQLLAPEGVRPHLVVTSLEGSRDPGGFLPKPSDAEFATIFNQWGAVRRDVPIEVGDVGAASDLKLDSAKAATASGTGKIDTGKPSQHTPNSALADVTAPGGKTGSLLEDVAIETVAEAAVATFTEPLPISPVEPTATAATLAAPSPLPESADLVAKADTGLVAAAPGIQPTASQHALAPQTPAPIAQPQPSPRTELVAAVAPATRVAPVAAAEPAANSAGLLNVQQPSGPAPLVLQPIKFKLQPPAKKSPPSASLAAARRSELAGQAVKPGLNATVSRKQGRLPDRLVGEFILHQVSVRLNDSPAGNVDVRIGGDASLSIRVGALLSVVEGRLEPELFAALNRSAGADAYVSFRELRAAGIDVRYEPAGDTIVLTAD